MTKHRIHCEENVEQFTLETN